MLLPTVKSKEKDVQLQNITLSLDNGTILLEHGELKFTYQRRYGLVGENGVGKLIDFQICRSQWDNIMNIDASQF